MSNLIRNNSIVLFQGDSITDAGRSRTNDNEMGHGYPNMIAAVFSAKYPEKNVKFINRGISGNRVKDLQARWKEDCLDIKPDWVSILIGINDCWRRYDSNDPTTAEDFEKGYRDILTRTVRETNAHLILCEPFVLPVPEDRKTWREDLDPKIQVVRQLAREFNAIYIPFDGIFAAASTKREPAFWAADGVHPTSAGHALIALEWLKAVEQR
ncbi:MAG: SGNH/GDSL hydrolase family protein [Clostridiaceae bacterium]|jgi:acyl-CoA thioesterase-1|nr:SGNH/GDSL hydrolase family protein [Clostridiaceae bacterium]